jgi:hypothetical protein
VSRTAGLLAIAVFGVVIMHAFNSSLLSKLNTLQLDEATRKTVHEQSVKMAGIELPETIDTSQRQAIEGAIGESYIFGLRTVMLASAGLAALSALSSWLLIGRTTSRTPQTRQD